MIQKLMKLFKKDERTIHRLNAAEFKIDAAYNLIFALARIMAINPKLLNEYAKDKDGIIKYLEKLSHE